MKGQQSFIGVIVGSILALIIGVIVIYAVGFPILSQTNSSFVSGQNASFPTGEAMTSSKYQQTNWNTILILTGVMAIIVALVVFMSIARMAG